MATHFPLNEEGQRHSDTYMFNQLDYDVIGSFFTSSCTFFVCLFAVIVLLLTPAPSNSGGTRERPNSWVVSFFGFSGVALFLSGVLPIVVATGTHLTSDMLMLTALERLLLGCYGFACTSLTFAAMGILLGDDNDAKSCRWSAVGLAAYSFTVLAIIFDNQYFVVVFQFLVFPFAAFVFATQEVRNQHTNPNKQNKKWDDLINMTKATAIFLVWGALFIQLFVCTAPCCSAASDRAGYLDAESEQDCTPNNLAPRVYSRSGGLFLHQLLSLAGFFILAGAEILLPSPPMAQLEEEGEQVDGDNNSTTSTVTIDYDDEFVGRGSFVEEP